MFGILARFLQQTAKEIRCPTAETSWWILKRSNGLNENGQGLLVTCLENKRKEKWGVYLDHLMYINAMGSKSLSPPVIVIFCKHVSGHWSCPSLDSVQVWSTWWRSWGCFSSCWRTRAWVQPPQRRWAWSGTWSNSCSHLVRLNSKYITAELNLLATALLKGFTY